MTVLVNGHKWEVGSDGRLQDRRETPQDGIRLDSAARRALQLTRLCGSLPLDGIFGHLTEMGLVTRLGCRATLTSEGELLADILLADPRDN